MNFGITREEGDIQGNELTTLRTICVLFA